MREPDLNHFGGHSRVQDAVLAERKRAHAKHDHPGNASMERRNWNDPIWGHVVGEEVGEIHRSFCEYAHGNMTRTQHVANLREELIQVMAMCEAWVIAIDGPPVANEF